MSQSHVDVRTQYIIAGTVRNALAGFLVERKSRRLAKGTLTYYQNELNLFAAWLDGQGVGMLEEVSAATIRQYMLELEKTRNAGGVHAAFRAIRAMWLWYESEFEPEAWRNPIKKVKGPKVAKNALPGVSTETIKRMIEAAGMGDYELRDRLILMVLFDTGARASEVINLDVEDVDLMTGAVIIRHGKGDKRRTVFLGGKSRKALRNYFKERGYTPGALFRSKEGERLKYQGLVKIIRRRAENAGVAAPGLHDFRRAFAVTMLRNGCDLARLADLMGHSNLEVLRRYLHLVDDDLREVHALAGPVDRL